MAKHIVREGEKGKFHATDRLHGGARRVRGRGLRTGAIEGLAPGHGGGAVAECNDAATAPPRS